MSSHFTPFTLKDISRPGGGFAMLAVDQREAMRLMFAAAGQPKPIADSVLTDFKVAATRILLLMLLPFWRINNFVLSK